MIFDGAERPQKNFRCALLIALKFYTRLLCSKLAFGKPGPCCIKPSQTMADMSGEAPEYDLGLSGPGLQRRKRGSRSQKDPNPSSRRRPLRSRAGADHADQGRLGLPLRL